MRTLVLLALLGACEKGSSSSSSSSGDSCGPDALGIPSAKLLTEWQPPPTCSVHLSQGETVIVRSAADVAKVFDCAPKALGIDFTKTTLVVAPRFLSEGMSSYLAYDDGKTITLVSRHLRPCPNGSHPLMGYDNYIYAVAAGDRAVAEGSCTLERSCR